MATIKTICFPEGDNTRRLLANIQRLEKVSGKSFSEITRIALERYAEKEIRLVQSRLDTFKDPLEDTLERIHREYVKPNVDRYGNFEECLKGKDLWTAEVIQYSVSRRWLRSVLTR